MDQFSEDLLTILIDENQEQRTQPKCGDPDNLLHQLCKVTDDDAVTLLDACVSVFILLASAVTYFVSIDLLVLLVRALAQVWPYWRAA